MTEKFKKVINGYKNFSKACDQAIEEASKVFKCSSLERAVAAINEFRSLIFVSILESPEREPEILETVREMSYKEIIEIVVRQHESLIAAINNYTHKYNSNPPQNKNSLHSKNGFSKRLACLEKIRNSLLGNKPLTYVLENLLSQKDVEILLKTLENTEDPFEIDVALQSLKIEYESKPIEILRSIQEKDGVLRVGIHRSIGLSVLAKLNNTILKERSTANSRNDKNLWFNLPQNETACNEIIKAVNLILEEFNEIVVAIIKRRGIKVKAYDNRSIFLEKPKLELNQVKALVTDGRENIPDKIPDGQFDKYYPDLNGNWFKNL